MLDCSGAERRLDQATEVGEENDRLTPREHGTSFGQPDRQPAKAYSPHVSNGAEADVFVSLSAHRWLRLVHGTARLRAQS